MLTIPKSSSRNTGNTGADTQLDPNKRFGNKSIALTPKVNIPDIAAIQYSGDIAISNAIGSVGNDLMIVSKDLKDREDTIRKGKDKNRATVAAKKYQQEKKARRDVIAAEGKANGWDATRIDKEVRASWKSLKEHYVANNEFTDEEISSGYKSTLESVDVMDENGQIEWSTTNQIREAEEITTESDTLNIQNLETSSNANDVVSSFKSQAAMIVKKMVDPTVTQIQVDAEIADTANSYLSTFITGQRRDGKIGSLEEMEDIATNILAASPELAASVDVVELQKELKEFNKQVEREEKEAQTKVDTTLGGDIEYTVAMGGDVDIEEDIINTGASKKTKARLVNLVNAQKKEQAKIVKDGEWANSMATNEPGYFYGRDGVKDRAAVEAQFDSFDKSNEDLMASSPAAGWQARANNAVKMGALSSRAKGDIIQMLQSDDPTQVSFGVDALRIIEDANPLIIEQEFGKYNKPALLMADLVSEGYGIEEARDVIKRDQQMTPETRKALEAKAKDEFPEDVTSSMEDYLEDHPQYDWYFTDNPSMPIAMQEEVKKIQAQEFVRNGGNATIAKERALKTVFGRWGRTNVDGSDRMMVKAPELVYGNGGESPWIKEQFHMMLLDMGMDEDNINVSVIVNPATANQKKTTYMVRDNNQMGMYIRNEDNTIWNFQPNREVYDAAVIELKRIEREAEIAFEEELKAKNKKGKEAFRDTFGIK